MLFGARMDRDTNQALVDTVFSYLGEVGWHGFTQVRTTLEAKVRRNGHIGLIMINTASFGTGKTLHRRQLQKHHWVRVYNDEFLWGIRYAQRMVRFSSRFEGKDVHQKYKDALIALEDELAPTCEYTIGWWWARRCPV